MTTMLEKMARALMEASPNAMGAPSDVRWEVEREYWCNTARSALQAIREPDGPVCEAGAEAWEVTAPVRPTFTAMIDAILEGKA